MKGNSVLNDDVLIVFVRICTLEGCWVIKNYHPGSATISDELTKNELIGTS